MIYNKSLENPTRKNRARLSLTVKFTYMNILSTEKSVIFRLKDNSENIEATHRELANILKLNFGKKIERSENVISFSKSLFSAASVGWLRFIDGGTVELKAGNKLSKLTYSIRFHRTFSAYGICALIIYFITSSYIPWYKLLLPSIGISVLFGVVLLGFFSLSDLAFYTLVRRAVIKAGGLMID